MIKQLNKFAARNLQPAEEEYDPTEGVTEEFLITIDIDEFDEEWRSEVDVIVCQRKTQLEEQRVDDLIESLRQDNSCSGRW